MQLKLKQLGVTLALAGMLSTQAYAHEAATEAAPLAAAAAQAAPANVLTQDDLVALFGAQEAGKPLQLALLSEQEMRETEGAWFLPVVAWTLGGAALGSYTAWRQNGTVTWRDVGAGATAGFYASPMGRPFGNVGRFVMGGLGSSAWYWR
jgi:hypothetical protein